MQGWALVPGDLLHSVLTARDGEDSLWFIQKHALQDRPQGAHRLLPQGTGTHF